MRIISTVIIIYSLNQLILTEEIKQGEIIMGVSYNYSVSIASEYVCDLGEGPFYEPTSDTIYYVDAFKGTIIRLPLNNETKDRHVLGNQLVSLVIPYSDGSQSFLITLGGKVAKYNWDTRNIQVLASLPPHSIGNERFNDGKCDARGRLFIGSVVESKNMNGIVKGNGSIYRLDGNQLIKVADGFTLSNGMDWSVDGRTLFFNDSEDQKIYVFDYNPEHGTLTNKRVLIEFKNNTSFKSDEYPDGLVVDKNDFIWTALYGGGRLVKINPNTLKVELSIEVPAKKVTSLTFGGPKLDKIYVTSAWSETESRSGKLYMVSSKENGLNGKSFAHKFASF